MAIELMSATKRKLLLVLTMCILAVCVMGAADVTSELVAQPTENEKALTYLRSLSHSLATETASEHRTAWQEMARKRPVSFLKACAN